MPIMERCPSTTRLQWEILRTTRGQGCRVGPQSSSASTESAGWGSWQAAVSGATSFAEWATAQGCDTTVLVDSAAPVTGNAIFQAVDHFVQTGVYSQLIVYFAG